MATLKVYRETALPGTLQPYALYLIAPSGDAAHLEVVATDATGTASRRVYNKADIQAMIDASMVAAGGTAPLIADNIAARDALTPDSNIFCYVVDATGDPTVDSGGATYLYNKTNATWIKVNEAESMDLVLTWANITDGPSSSPAQIDGAVAKAHAHSNKTQLDKIDENVDGEMTYNGTQVKTEWASTVW